MKRIILTLLLLNLLTIPSFAQREGALASLTRQRSLPLIGAGNIGAAKANNDPIGYYLNPAILGYTSQNNHTSLFFMPTKAEWGGNSEITFNTFGFNIGYNLTEYNIPISVGFGYMNDILNYDQYSTEGRDIFNSYDLFNNFSFGIGLDYYLLLNLGFSIKSYDSKPSLFSYRDQVNTKGTAFDYGAMIIVPISKLIFKDVTFDFGSSPIKPTMNFTIGYSLTNVGEEVVYFNKERTDPHSRTARLGYTFDFGFDTFIDENIVNFISYSFTAEAEDILINQKPCSEGVDYCYPREFDSYQLPLGDIDINKHLIILEEDEKVIVHIGHTIKIFETITFTFGSYRGGAYMNSWENIETSNKGFGISSEGVLKLWSASSNNSIINYIAKHFVLEYYYTSRFEGWWVKTDMHGISLHMNNIEL